MKLFRCRNSGFGLLALRPVALRPADSAVVAPRRLPMNAVVFADAVGAFAPAPTATQASVNRSDRGVERQAGFGQELIDGDQDVALAEAAAQLNAITFLDDAPERALPPFPVSRERPIPCFVFLGCVSHDANKAGTSTAVNPPRRRVSEFLTPLGKTSVFNFDGHSIRIHIDAEGKEWFCANDICDRLEITNVSDAVSRLADSEKADIGITNISSGSTSQLFINEGGVWDLVFKSRKPEAKAIWHKIRHEILPQIRKTGRWMTTSEGV